MKNTFFIPLIIFIFVLTFMMILLYADHSSEITDSITNEQRQEAETELRQWIDDWEKLSDIYKNNENAEIAKGLMNEIAGHYNKLILKYGYLFGETLPEGIYAAIEITE